MVLAEHNNRLPPAADKRRALWRRGQRKFALQAIIFFGHRKSRECSPKIRDFRANGIPVQECVDFFDTLNRCLTNRSVNAIIAVQFRELDETQAERKSAFCYDFDL